MKIDTLVRPDFHHPRLVVMNPINPVLRNDHGYQCMHRQFLWNLHPEQTRSIVYSLCFGRRTTFHHIESLTALFFFDLYNFIYFLIFLVNVFLQPWLRYACNS